MCVICKYCGRKWQKTNVKRSVILEANRSPFYSPAIAAGHIAVVRLLVESKKVDVNVTNNQGDTPLHKVRTSLLVYQMCAFLYVI